MASYMDMVTVLMCMFIVLFAMSTVDQEKYEQLSASLATGFGQEPSKDVDVSDGVIVPADLMDEDGESFADVDVDVTAAQREFDELSALRERLRKALADRDLEEDVTFTIDERGLTIGLVSAETFFDTNSTVLSRKAVRVLDALGSVLVDTPNEISVEGHADARGSVAPFPTNWELSSGRSTQVLRHLVEDSGIASAHIKSVGFGDTRPIAKGKSEKALAQNRRVDIVVLSDATEEVRELIPGAQPAKPSS